MGAYSASHLIATWSRRVSQPKPRNDTHHASDHARAETTRVEAESSAPFSGIMALRYRDKVRYTLAEERGSGSVGQARLQRELLRIELHPHLHATERVPGLSGMCTPADDVQ